MPLPIIAISVNESDAPQAAPPPVTPNHEVAVVGDMRVAAGGAANTNLQTAFPLNTPVLIPNRAAWTGAWRGRRRRRRDYQRHLRTRGRPDSSGEDGRPRGVAAIRRTIRRTRS